VEVSYAVVMQRESFADDGRGLEVVFFRSFFTPWPSMTPKPTYSATHIKNGNYSKRDNQ
jgi:hypothetical protein